MKLKNTFVQGKMQKDIDERLLPKGQYIHAENIRLSNSDSSDVGAIENVKGNEKLTNLGLINGKTIGSFSDNSNQKLYWFVTSDNKDLVVEYNSKSSTIEILLESTKPNSLLNFNPDYLITGVSKMINGEFDKDLLIWTDNLNPPRKINIERAKNYEVDGFTEDEISVIKKPPTNTLQVTLLKTESELENNLEDKFISFAYRYKYLDGEYSALSSFTNYCFFPKPFGLNYQTMENEGMVNYFNAVDINFNTGDHTVTDIDIVYKETNSNNLWLIETFNKEEMKITSSWEDNSTQTFRFSNNKKYTTLPEDELYRTYDNVPRLVKSLDLLNNRLIFGNYIEGYDLLDIHNQPININYNVSMINTIVNPINENSFTSLMINDSSLLDTNNSSYYLINNSLKSNRDYEIGIVYMDEYGRSSTVITAIDNTIHNPTNNSIYRNRLRLSILNNAPYWATKYKIVVKQTKGDYDTIYTNVFYQDGIYIWVKLEGANVNKVKEGDTLIVKSDVGGALNDLVKTRVLEVTNKDKDFIEGNEDDEANSIIEESGLYMKLRPDNFNMEFDDDTIKTYEGSQHRRYPSNVYTSPNFEGGLNAGSTVRIYIKFSAAGSISYSKTYDKTFRVVSDYSSVQEWFEAEVEDLGSFGEDYTRGWGFTEDGTQFYARAHRDGTASRNVGTNIKFEILYTEGIGIFETQPDDTDINIFYETGQVFDIENGFHKGNVQDQSEDNDCIILLDFFNCYVQGNGAETYKYKDLFNANKLNIDLRPNSTSIEPYREIRRFADLTYSEPYNENNNLNGLNEFNLSKVNYKEDIDKTYGKIERIYSRDTDLIVFQEDKVSKVLYGKSLLMNADGTSNVTSIDDVLGQQVTFKGEYGISSNPESFCFDGYNIYFIDVKRGAVMKLGNNGLNDISKNGMRQFFRDNFKNSIDGIKLGAYDTYLDQFVISVPESNYTLTYDEKVKGWTSFHSFIPDFMTNMNSHFYSFKNGDLYLHHSDNADRNTYYDIFYPSKISFIVNDEPSMIKELQNVSFEGNISWETLIKAYVSNSDDFIESSIKSVEFVKKEGLWYAYVRRNEDVNQQDSKSMYGIGTVITSNNNIITVKGNSDLLVIGDEIIKGSDMSIIGTIISHQYDKSTNVSTIELDNNTLSINDFIAGRKNARIEGGNLRGYVMKLDLETNNTDKVELFAVNTDVIKSYT